MLIAVFASFGRYHSVVRWIHHGLLYPKAEICSVTSWSQVRERVKCYPSSQISSKSRPRHLLRLRLMSLSCVTPFAFHEDHNRGPQHHTGEMYGGISSLPPTIYPLQITGCVDRETHPAVHTLQEVGGLVYQFLGFRRARGNVTFKWT